MAVLLRCLELDLGSGWRNCYETSVDNDENTDKDTIKSIDGATDGATKHAPEKVEKQDADVDLPPLPKIIKNILPHFPELQEFTLNLETAHTTIFTGSGDSRESRKPNPVDERDLVIHL